MDLVKLKDKTNGAVIEVKKSLAADYIGTGRYEIVENKPVVNKEVKSISKEKTYKIDADTKDNF